MSSLSPQHMHTTDPFFVTLYYLKTPNCQYIAATNLFLDSIKHPKVGTGLSTTLVYVQYRVSLSQQADAVFASNK